jgi:hypothetical protein
MASEAEKAELKDAAKQRAAEQKAAVAAKEEQVKEFRQTAEETQAGGRAVTPMPVTEAEGEALEEYGPYDDYRVVPTSQGENAVPFRKVLFFVEQDRFDRKAGRMVRAMTPTYRNATSEEMAPILARKAKRKAAMAAGGGA